MKIGNNFILIFIISLCASSAVFSQRRGNEQFVAVAAVKKFYRFHLSNDDYFDEKGVMRRLRFFTPQLRRLFLSELERESEYLKKYPTDKPYFDSLPFQPIEFCKKDYRVGKPKIVYQSIFVKVHFVYSKTNCQSSDGAKIFYKIQLRKINGKWLINNVIYDNGDDLIESFKRAQKIS